MASEGPSWCAVRWAATLVEPLLSTTQRIRFDEDFRDVARTEPRWFCTFGAGVLWGVACSLPLEDPWRTAVVGPHGEATWPDGRPFGQRSDTDDVLRPIAEIDDESIDPATLALEDGISTYSASLIVTAFAGWRPTQGVLLEAMEHDDPDAVFNLVVSSTRWLEHRRRAYRPEEYDVWLDQIVLAWAHWAADAAADKMSSNVERELEFGAMRERERMSQIARDLEFFN